MTATITVLLAATAAIPFAGTFARSGAATLSFTFLAFSADTAIITFPVTVAVHKFLPRGSAAFCLMVVANAVFIVVGKLTGCGYSLT